MTGFKDYEYILLKNKDFIEIFNGGGTPPLVTYNCNFLETDSVDWTESREEILEKLKLLVKQQFID